jgi:cytochrome c oxidase subunit 2
MIAFGVFISVAKLRENLHVSTGRAPLVVNVSGGQWWWEIDTYEISMGQEVESCVKTEDVTHGMDIYAPDMTLVA